MLTVSPGCSRRRRCSRWQACVASLAAFDRLRRAQLDAAALARHDVSSRNSATPAWVAGSMRAVADSDDRAVARREIRLGCGVVGRRMLRRTEQVILLA
jgi:hypothetical protein